MYNDAVLRYLIRRIVLTIPVLLGVATLVFSLIHLIPGDPAESMLGEGASPALVAASTPGRFALVEVIGSPYACTRRLRPRCGVHLTAIPPSGPRN